jgi:uncharacterized RDD family membrane protein YckC
MAPPIHTPIHAPVPTALLAPPLARRLAGAVYESMLLFGVVFSAGLVFSIALQVRSGMDPRQPLLQAFIFVVCGAYCSWFWSKGQTLAMRAWRIELVDRHGRRLTQMRAVFRYLCAWLWVLPPLALLDSARLGGAQVAVLLLGWFVLYALLSRFHPQRQFLHDVIAGTRLITARDKAAP